jgi:hypothetical protein
MSTFLFSTTAVMLAYSQGLITLPYLLFLMSFISMQLIEFFLHISRGSGALNTIFSIAGLATIAAQPFFAIQSIKDADFAYKRELTAVYIAGMILFVAYLRPEFRTVAGPHGHLVWKWLRWPLAALLVWFGFFATPFIVNKSWLLLAFLTLTAGVSYASYAADGTWGSMWCWVANVVGFVYFGQVGYKIITGRKPMQF